MVFSLRDQYCSEKSAILSIMFSDEMRSCERELFVSNFVSSIALPVAVYHSWRFRSVFQRSSDKGFSSDTFNNAALQARVIVRVFCVDVSLSLSLSLRSCLLLYSPAPCVRSSSHIRLKIDSSLIEIRGNVVLEPQKDYCFFI